MQVKERTFSVSNMNFFTFNSKEYFEYFDFLFVIITPRTDIFDINITSVYLVML